MKNTMKKLLCMALAIMLLVSAVPVFAAADATLDVPVTVYVNGNPVGTKRLTVGLSQVTLNAETGMGMLDNTENRTFVRWENNGGETVTGGTLVVDTWLQGELRNGYSLKLYIEESYVTAYVKAYVDGVKVTEPSDSVKKGSTVVLNDNWAAKVGYGGKNATVTSGTLGNGASFTANGDFEVEVSVNLKNNNNGSEDKKDEESKPATTATFVSVITCNKTSGFVDGDYINCNLVSGKITQTDRDKVAKAIVGKNIVAWKRADNGQQAASLLDFDFSNLKEAINILPVYGNTNNNTTNGNITLTIKVGGATEFSEAISGTTKTVSTLISENLYNDWTSKYIFDGVKINNVPYGRADVEASAGDKVEVSLSRKYSKDNSNKVYLHVYLNKNAGEIAMTKDITNTYLMDDGDISRTEVGNYLKNNYYTAKDTSEAIEVDGLYLTENGDGHFPTSYYSDNKSEKIYNVDDKLEDGYVHVSVMLKNAKAKSSSTADSSNPKTGDSIMVPVMVAGLTASALAVAYVFGKKRIAR